MASRAAVLLLPLLLCIGACVCEYSPQELSTFVDTLLAEYDRAVPPALTTAVALALDVRHAAVCDTRATMRLLADLKISWQDSRVTWNASAWQGDSVLVQADRLWVPDVALASAGAAGEASSNLRARLTSSGAASAVLRLQLSVPLALQLTDWPRDQQEAVFEFTSRAHSADEIEITIGDYKSSVVVESGAWEVVGVTGEVRSGRGGSGAAWRVRAARRGGARALAAAAVAVSAAVLLLAAAALPRHQRAPLAACAAFLAALWLISAIFHVPCGVSTPRVLVVMSALCACGAACGAGAALAAWLAARRAPPPAAMRALLSRLAAVPGCAHQPDPDAASGASHGAWAAAAQLLDVVVLTWVVLTAVVLAAVQLFS